MAKKGQVYKTYSSEFKISVIMDMREQRLSYSETVRKYDLGSVQTGGARAMKLKGMSPVQYRTHSQAI